MLFLRIYKQVWEESQKEGGERNIFDYYLYRRISTLFLIPIRHSKFSPNLITSLSVVFSCIAAFCFFYGDLSLITTLGIVAMNVSLILDTLDGQYSRYTHLSSEFGGWIDGVSDSLKYIVLFIGITCGAFYNPYVDQQWFDSALGFFSTSPETVLIFGMWIISNFFMIYYVHASRYNLTINPGTVTGLRGYVQGKERKFHFGIESSLYTMFTVFLLCDQTYWLLLLLGVLLPILWVYPIYLVYRRAKLVSDNFPV